MRRFCMAQQFPAQSARLCPGPDKKPGNAVALQPEKALYFLLLLYSCLGNVVANYEPRHLVA